eukprot:403359145
MQSLISDLEKTQSKVLDQRKEMLNKIDALIGELTNAKTNIQRNIGGDETQVSMSIAPQLNELPKKGTDVVKKIINQNKVYYEHLSKYGKQIAKELTSKPEYEQPLFKEFQLNKPVLNQTIAEHMYRSGCYQAGEVFTQEAQIDLNSNKTDKQAKIKDDFFIDTLTNASFEDFKLKYKILNEVVVSLHSQKSTALAIEWAQQNKEALEKIKSDLLFNLHKGEFCEMIKENVKMHIKIRELKEQHAIGTSQIMSQNSSWGAKGSHINSQVDNGQVGSVQVDANGDVKMEEDVPIKQENPDEQSSIIQMNVNEAQIDFLVVGLIREQALQEIQKLDKELQIKNQKLLKYSQQSMRPFHSKYSQEIHHLMGSLIYLDQLAEYQHTADKSPSKHSALSPHVQQYQDLIKQDNWFSLEQQFMKDYCKVQGLSSESSLLLITKASMLGLPILTKAIQKMNLKNEKAGFSTLNKAHNELPIEIDLGNEFKFHDIFICPVSKEISHSRDNNPMLLSCGHVMSKNSLTKHSRAAINRENKFKCHTCPATMTMANVQEIKIN